jgi:2-polyprenyl-3-methyl-5-hydroxy-6-metoxy-1,4-benzoquinol methylase
MLAIGNAYPHLAQMVKQQLAVFPDHESYLERRFANEDSARLAFDDFVADKILRIAGSDIARVCDDYRWLCGEMLNEELYFRRNGKYRLSKIADAIREVYANLPFMSRYVNGILASLLWWDNHNAALRYFRDVFVAGNAPGFTHLEVGPGHGLYLHLAASSPACVRAEGWDLSDASLAATRGALKAMDSTGKIELRKVDFSQDAPEGRFQSITFSEVLEHLEDPVRALKMLYNLLDKGGRIFVNAPVNSPAPDHIYLFRTPEEVVEMMESVGFRVQESLLAPCTGASLARARKLQLSISACVIATK